MSNEGTTNGPHLQSFREMEARHAAHEAMVTSFVREFIAKLNAEALGNLVANEFEKMQREMGRLARVLEDIASLDDARCDEAPSMASRALGRQR
jgi:oligoribonuclease (3'-5' exoribonuclease)